MLWANCTDAVGCCGLIDAMGYKYRCYGLLYRCIDAMGYKYRCYGLLYRCLDAMS
jgi:hypothetical protein